MRDDSFPISDPGFLERYQPGPLLGAGGMARVYAGVQTALSRPVAIKVLDARLLPDPGSAERFVAEARMAAGILSPHVVVVFDSGIASGRPYLVTELVEGRSLEKLLNERPLLPVADVLAILIQVLAGLEAIHRRGIVHRDLKPENILVAHGETLGVKIADFGIAKQRDRAGGVETESGIILGTPAYMAPEQVANDPVSPATDLYAVAVLAFRLMTGHHPFNAATTLDLLRAQLLNEPNIPEELEPLAHDFLARGLRKRPEHRFASASQMQAEVAKMASALADAASFRAPGFFGIESPCVPPRAGTTRPRLASGSITLSAASGATGPTLSILPRVPARYLMRAVLGGSLAVLLPVLYAGFAPRAARDAHGWPILPAAEARTSEAPRRATLAEVGRAAHALAVEDAARALFDVARAQPELASLRRVSLVATCRAAQELDLGALGVLEAALIRAPTSTRLESPLAVRARRLAFGVRSHDAPEAGELFVSELAAHLAARRWREAEGLVHAFTGLKRLGTADGEVEGSPDAGALHPVSAFAFVGALAGVRAASNLGQLMVAARHLEAFARAHPEHPAGDAARALLAPLLAAAGDPLFLGAGLERARTDALAPWPRLAALAESTQAGLSERWLAGAFSPAELRRALLVSEAINELNATWWRERGETGAYGSAMHLSSKLPEGSPVVAELEAELEGLDAFYVESPLPRGLVVKLARALGAGTPRLVAAVEADAAGEPVRPPKPKVTRHAHHLHGPGHAPLGPHDGPLPPNLLHALSHGH